jgi:hypothetical protein
VPILGRADEIVVGDVEHPPRVDELRRDGVHPRLRVRPVLDGSLSDLLPVLVETGQEVDVVTCHPPIACERIGRDRRVGGTEVGYRVDVVDRCGQIESIH